MSIQDNYDKSVNVMRLVPGDGDTQEYALHIEGVSCHIQPLDEAYTEDLDGNAAKDWLMFSDVADILEGDRIVDGSLEYKIVGLESYNFLGENRHMEIRIRLSNP